MGIEIKIDNPDSSNKMEGFVVRVGKDIYEIKSDGMQVEHAGVRVRFNSNYIAEAQINIPLDWGVFGESKPSVSHAGTSHLEDSPEGTQGIQLDGRESSLFLWDIKPMFASTTFTVAHNGEFAHFYMADNKIEPRVERGDFVGETAEAMDKMGWRTGFSDEIKINGQLIHSARKKFNPDLMFLNTVAMLFNLSQDEAKQIVAFANHLKKSRRSK